MMAKFPHCDPRVLHAPGECIFCDKHKDSQDKRIREGINFTGHDDKGLKPCPADEARGDTHQSWYGNRAQLPEWTIEEDMT